VEVLNAFLSNFYGELTNDENKTSVKEAWPLVSSIVRRMFDDIAVDRCLASFVDFKNELKEQAATEYLWASLDAHRVMTEYTTHEFRHHPSIALIINYQLYRHRAPWSGFNDLRKEVSGSRRLASEVKRRSDRSRNASYSRDRGGGGSSDEEKGGSKRWSEPSGRQERRRVDPQLCFSR
jgi:hypothetical protein